MYLKAVEIGSRILKSGIMKRSYLNDAIGRTMYRELQYFPKNGTPKNLLERGISEINLLKGVAKDNQHVNQITLRDLSGNPIAVGVQEVRNFIQSGLSVESWSKLSEFGKRLAKWSERSQNGKKIINLDFYSP